MIGLSVTSTTPRNHTRQFPYGHRSGSGIEIMLCLLLLSDLPCFVPERVAANTNSARLKSNLVPWPPHYNRHRLEHHEAETTMVNEVIVVRFILKMVRPLRTSAFCQLPTYCERLQWRLRSGERVSCSPSNRHEFPRLQRTACA
jgi:hypothetical protein